MEGEDADADKQQ